MKRPWLALEGEKRQQLEAGSGGLGGSFGALLQCFQKEQPDISALRSVSPVLNAPPAST